MLPGFKHRLRAELYSLLKQPRYAEKLCLPAFKFHRTPAKANYAAWLGGKKLKLNETHLLLWKLSLCSYFSRCHIRGP